MATIERTAKAEFRVGDDGLKVDGEVRVRGDRVLAGQVVEIPSKARLKKLVDAGLVESAEDDDAAVPKRAKSAVIETAVVSVEHQAAAQEKRRAATEARAEAVKAQADLDALKARGNADAAVMSAAEAEAKDADAKAVAAETAATEAEAAAA